MYLQYKSWRANRRTKRMLQGRPSSKGSTPLPKLFERKETPAPAPAPSPIILKALPCPCSRRGSLQGGSQEVLSGLLPIIKQQFMQLQSQLIQENTRILTDVQDVTSDHPYNQHSGEESLDEYQKTGKWRGHAQRFNLPTYNKKKHPPTSIAVTFCGYPSDEVRIDLV